MTNNERLDLRFVTYTASQDLFPATPLSRCKNAFTAALNSFLAVLNSVLLLARFLLFANLNGLIQFCRGFVCGVLGSGVIIVFLAELRCSLKFSCQLIMLAFSFASGLMRYR